MQHYFKVPAWCAVWVCLGVALSGCSTLSDAASSSVAGLSKLNPFAASSSPKSGEAQTVAPASTTPATLKPTEASGKVILVSAPPASATVETTLADNKQCTTFCALPMRKPQ